MVLIYDMNKISHHPAAGGGQWSHGMAISRGRQYGCGQLQAAAGSLIRASVMSPRPTCRCWGRQTDYGPSLCRQRLPYPSTASSSLLCSRSQQFQSQVWKNRFRQLLYPKIFFLRRLVKTIYLQYRFVSLKCPRIIRGLQFLISSIMAK